jgi:hypothetical protein
LREFVLRQDEALRVAQVWRWNLLFLFPLRASSNKGAPPGTLNDTELRKNFRRKNTARKSFLGHARGLNNLPIEAATTRPTRDSLPTRR